MPEFFLKFFTILSSSLLFVISAILFFAGAACFCACWEAIKDDLEASFVVRWLLRGVVITTLGVFLCQVSFGGLFNF
jgi:hypothetical protein